MSDSPLDGGSGWPTSAYAIVPRQPAPQEEAPAPAEPEPAPVRGEPEAGEPERIEQPSRKGRIAALAVGLIVLVIAAVGGVLATRDDSPKSPTEAAAATTAAPALPVAGDSASASAGASEPAGAGTSGSASADPSGQPSGAVSADPSSGASTVPAAPPSTGILRAGTAQFVVLAGQPDDAYDLDSGLKQSAGADITAGAIGLTAANGARFAVLLTADTPSLAACTGVPDAAWAGQVVLASLLPGSKVCVRTSDGRYAWFMTRIGEPVAGALWTSNLDFIVYKKAGD
ncbi:hypothetical protein [Dactylosporangium sp. CA-233914]|uniref:hypothetical protein n=1 Tax=Dactylosporangium sp. CA-233914 TaxID=3239934 RepID=UPI003D94EE6D